MWRNGKSIDQCPVALAGLTRWRIRWRWDWRGGGNNHAAESGERVIHVPELGTHLLGHADAVAGVAGGTLAVDGPAGEELFLHLEVEFKTAAGEDDAFLRLDEAGQLRQGGAGLELTP